MVSIQSLTDQIEALSDDDLRLLVLTGGEPMLQQHQVARFLERLRTERSNLRCEVETNGTVPPTRLMEQLVYRYVVSPKLRHAGGLQTSRIRNDVLIRYVQLPATILKFVIAGAEDMSEVAAIVEKTQIRARRVWLMPLAANPAELVARTPIVSELAISEGYNFSGRTHLLQWGGARGH
jgi:7-carboxy-7-deazaguanine synthase